MKNPAVKLQFKKLDTSWIYSLPFGKHNAAIPEMKYKLPKDILPEPTKLSYYDIINRKQGKKENDEEEKKNQNQ